MLSLTRAAVDVPPPPASPDPGAFGAAIPAIMALGLDRIAARLGDAPARPRLIADLKQHLADGRAQIRARLDAGEGGNRPGHLCVQRLAILMDRIVIALFDHAERVAYPVANPTMGEQLAVIATGGYGRGEMAPGSDIDLQFILPYKQTPRAEQVVEFVLYALWDLQLKVGHAVRSVDDCMRMAKADMAVRTSLFENRFLAGRDDLYQEFRQRFLTEVQNGTAHLFVEAKLEERDRRHAKLGDSRYVLEPNVKESKGGLRDLQTLYWIAKYFYAVTDVADLVQRGVLLPEEARRFADAEDFLWAVRCHLHYLTGRSEDRLTFDLQPEVARRLGYVAGEIASNAEVEHFMKRYFLAAKDVGDLTRIFCAAIQARTRRPTRIGYSFWRWVFGRREVDGFGFDGQRLTLPADDLFETDPVAMIRVFHVAQRHGVEVHPDALRVLTRAIPLIDDGLRANREANRLFLEILTDTHDPSSTLRRMNEAGLLGAFVPEFGEVVAQMQFDMYHAYTVDEHTLRCLANLYRLRDRTVDEELPLAREVAGKLSAFRALCVALLLHDVAKGSGEDHSVAGERITRSLGQRFGLEEEEVDTAAWLVLHHIAMSDMAFKRDVEDDRTIADFAALAQSVERLRLLFLFTIADIRGVGPGRWSSWRGTLLTALYRRTEAVLIGELDTTVRGPRVEAAQAAALAAAPAADRAGLDHLVAAAPAGYWLSFPAAIHATHAGLLRGALEAERPLTVDIEVEPESGVSQVTVHAADHPGLFSRLAGALAVAGASIVDAKIFTLADGSALDIFHVQDAATGGTIDDGERGERISRAIERVLTGDLKPELEIAKRLTTLGTRFQVFHVPPRVLVDNDASTTHTVIEVNARDRVGLLFDVTRCLTRIGLQIGTAKISTYGLRAVDVFYVKDVFGLKVTHEQKLSQVRSALIDVLRSEAG